MKLKVIIIVLVALLSGIFFWQTTNRFLYPSKAASSAGSATSIPLPFLNTAPTTIVIPTVATGTVATPTVSATASDSRITPTSGATGNTGGTCSKAKGDFNCDGKVDLLDFDIFRREFTRVLQTKESDANSDGKIDLVDFNAFREGMFPKI